MCGLFTWPELPHKIVVSFHVQRGRQVGSVPLVRAVSSHSGSREREIASSF